MKTSEEEKLKSVIKKLQTISQYFNEIFNKNSKDFKDELIIFNGQIWDIFNFTNDFEQTNSANAITHLSKILREQKALRNILALGCEPWAKDMFYLWQEQITVLKQVLEKEKKGVLKNKKINRTFKKMS